MKEAYVTLEIAKRLQALGFHWETNTYYNSQNNQIRTVCDSADWNDNENTHVDRMIGTVSVPTHQMVIDWLIDKHNIIIVVEPNHHTDNEFDAHIWKGHYRSVCTMVGYPNRFEANECAIEYALNIIEQNND